MEEKIIYLISFCFKLVIRDHSLMFHSWQNEYSSLNTVDIAYDKFSQETPPSSFTLRDIGSGMKCQPPLKTKTKSINLNLVAVDVLKRCTSGI